VVFTRGFDYWESGMDLYPGQDMYDSFCNYQTALLAEFDRLSSEFNFAVVNAAPDARTVCGHLKKDILELLEKDSRKTFITKQHSEVMARSSVKLEDTTIGNLHTVRVSDLFPTSPLVAQASNGNGHHVTRQK
jgi:hypothetical protein